MDLLDEVVGPADWADRLPTVLGPTEAAGPPCAAGRADLDVGDVGLVGPGTGDNMAAALGIGLAPGQACVSIGTSGTVYARSDGRWPTRRARWPGSPTPPAASSPWPAP